MFASLGDNLHSLLLAQETGRFRELKRVEIIFETDEHANSSLQLMELRDQMPPKFKAFGVVFEMLCTCFIEAKSSAQKCNLACVG